MGDQLELLQVLVPRVYQLIVVQLSLSSLSSNPLPFFHEVEAVAYWALDMVYRQYLVRYRYDQTVPKIDDPNQPQGQEELHDPMTAVHPKHVLHHDRLLVPPPLPKGVSTQVSKGEEIGVEHGEDGELLLAGERRRRKLRDQMVPE